jgi:riboflavin biosynthesis pyrimidine reductase
MSAGEVIRLWPDPDTAAALDEAALARWYPRTDSPTLRVNFVSSVDGAVTLNGFSEGLSSRGDKRVFGVLRMVCDALVVAAGTLRHEGYGPLRLDEARRAWRRDNGLPEFPTLVVVSGSLALDPKQAAFADAPVPPVVVTHAAAPGRLRAALAAVADVVEVGEVGEVGEARVDLAAMVEELHERGFRQLLCEGGPLLFGGLTEADLVDEVCLTISPLLAGAGAGRITAGPPSAPRALTLRHVLAADGGLLLRYTRG